MHAQCSMELFSVAVANGDQIAAAAVAAIGDDDAVDAGSCLCGKEWLFGE